MAPPQGPLVASSIESSVARPLADFPSDIWGDYFISMPFDDSKFKSDSMQSEVLKEKVMKMLQACTSDQVEKIELINLLCRLGVSYHFQDVIEDELNQIFDSQSHFLDKKDYDLYTVALVFQVFRQHGLKLSCDVFYKFKVNDGKFKESIISDIKGMLSLYEAAHFRTRGEEILDEALSFTKSHLESFAAQSNGNLAKHIINALKEPMHVGIPRLEARKYIDWYGSYEGRNETLLNFAKLDFNTLQFVHQQELREISKWWKNTNIPTELHYARHRLVETYFWSSIVRFEPQYALSRMMHCKYTQLLTSLNDTYDAYGTNKEHHCFTEAIERWDYAAVDQLPDYMKILYKVFLDLFCEFDDIVTPKGRSYSTNYSKEGLKEMVRCYQKKSDWCQKRYEPSLEQYFGNELITGGIIAMSTVFFMGMDEKAGIREYEWLIRNPRICKAGSVISRLMDDISTHEDEQKRQHIPSSVECYMKQHGVSQNKAIEELQKMVENAWKEVNEECMRPTDVPMDILISLLNTARFLHFTYKGMDMYTFSEHMKEYIIQLFIDPISI